MPAGIAGDRAAYAGTEDKVWHHLGTYFGDRRVNGSEIVNLAGANWEVREEPLFIQKPDGTFFKAPYGIALVRDPWEGTYDTDEGKVTEDMSQPVQLGLIKGGERKKYVVRQNLELATFFDELVANDLLTYTSAAVLERGVGFFIAAEMARDTVRKNPDGKDDVVVGYATLYNRHDGGSSSKVNWSKVRVVCTNTLQSALASGFTTRIVHAGNAQIRFDQAKKELQSGAEDFGKVMDELRAINAVRANDARVAKFFEVVFPVTKEDLEKQKAEYSTRRQNQIKQITKLALTGKGNNGQTMYDYFNGLTQYLDHDEDGEGAVTEKVFVSSNFGGRAKTRERAYDALLEMVA